MGKTNCKTAKRQKMETCDQSQGIDVKGLLFVWLVHADMMGAGRGPGGSLERAS
jgi:hypothetical protein